MDDDLDSSCLEFPIFQYFLSVVPTTYIDSSRRKIQTSQVSVEKRKKTRSIEEESLANLLT